MRRAWWPLIIFALVLPLVFAQVDLKNASIQTNYTGGESLRGKLTLQFTQEPSTSQVTSSFNTTIGLLDWLTKNSFQEGKEYTCTVTGCGSSYIKQQSITTLSLHTGEKKTVGFSIQGNNAVINTVSLKIKSSAPVSCTRQLLIDVLNKNESFFGNTASTLVSCGAKYQGCFDSSLQAYDPVLITSTGATKTYCENVTLPASPAFNVGARVTNSTLGYTPLVMTLYNAQGDTLGTCTLPRHMQQVEDLSCFIQASIQSPSSAIACISAQSGSSITTNYQLDSEQSGSVCGGTDLYSLHQRDYAIFAKALQFAPLDLVLNETTFLKSTGMGLASYLDSIVLEKYQRNCSLGCAVPLQILADQDQDLTFSFPQMQYDADGNTLLSNQLYVLDQQPSSLNSGNIILDLAKANFVLPLNPVDKKLQITIGTNQLFSTPLSLNITPGFLFDVVPKVVFIGLDTSFSIITSENISSAVWNFGDGTTTTSQEKYITHMYKERKEYTLIVEVTKKDGVKATRSFILSAGDPKTSTESLLAVKEKNLQQVSTVIQTYPSWVRKELEKKIDVLILNASLQTLKQKMASVKNDEDYTLIITQLSDLSLPEQLGTSISGTLPLALGYTNLDPAYIATYSGKDTLTISEKENLRLEIIDWISKHYTVDISFAHIGSRIQGQEAPLFTTFKVIITPQGEAQNAFFILDYPKDQIIFMQGYNEKSITASSTGTLIPVQSATTLEFLLPGKVDVSELGAYISPQVKDLQSANVIEAVQKNQRNRFALYAYIFLVFFTFIVYIALQEWYKRSYETYLFRNRDDLYNIVNFIGNARTSGLSDSDIRRKLASMNWRGEQINYAFKKIDGKRTGMLEIPLFKAFERKKLQRELVKRQQRNGDVRFIKRPYL